MKIRFLRFPCKKAVETGSARQGNSRLSKDGHIEISSGTKVLDPPHVLC